MKKVYLDYASLTPIDKKVAKFMKKYESMDYGNPSALYGSGVAAKKVLLESKEKIAKVIHAHVDEIIFTANGTEANELVLNMVPQGKQIIISDIEHSSIILNPNSIHIPVDKNGVVDLDQLKKAIMPDTFLISIMLVNNEIGTIEPITEIAKIVRHYRKANNSIYPLLHTDACQAFTTVPVNVEKLGVDLLTLDSHKTYGPRGVGMLYVKRGIKITRGGTENIPGIAGFAFALENADKIRDKEVARLSELKTYFIDGLKKINLEIKVNADLTLTSAHIINISIPNIDNEFFLFQLDAKGIECSTKSACLKDEDESYVLKAIGADSSTSLRFSFGRYTTKSDIKYTLKTIENIL
jgi:cysteine desulfurase